MFTPLKDSFYSDDYDVVAYCHIMKLLILMIERDMITEKDADWIISMDKESITKVPKEDKK